jgi:channel protein (hemolysin III family)
VTEPALYSIPGFSDPVSSLSHLLGAGVFFVQSLFLMRRGWGNWGRVFCLWVFAFSGVFLLSTSGVYHLLTPGRGGRAVLQRLDHSAIFVLIAGTFTPVHGILFRGWLRWLPLFLIWSAAATGITLKTIFFNDVSEWFGLALYLGLGWIGVASGVLLYSRFGYAFVRPLLWGALAYTLGAVLEFQRWPIVIPRVLHAHELFHLAVLTGLFCHWRFVMQFASGSVPGPAMEGQERLSPSVNGSAKDWSPPEQWRHTVVTVLETRLGTLPEELAAELGAIESLDCLNGLLRVAVTCASYVEFREDLGGKARFSEQKPGYELDCRANHSNH